jgi:hypothetical protein
MVSPIEPVATFCKSLISKHGNPKGDFRESLQLVDSFGPPPKLITGFKALISVSRLKEMQCRLKADDIR